MLFIKVSSHIVDSLTPSPIPDLIDFWDILSLSSTCTTISSICLIHNKAVLVHLLNDQPTIDADMNTTLNKE